MDELERATEELVRLVEPLGNDDFARLRDPETDDASCRSIQTVVHHVVRAGYAHANYVRMALGGAGSRVEVPFGSREESVTQLRAMLAYVEATLDGRRGMSDEEMAAVEIASRWGQVYDLEQMLEHAVVHVLRHRRQIERFLAEPGLGE